MKLKIIQQALRIDRNFYIWAHGETGVLKQTLEKASTTTTKNYTNVKKCTTKDSIKKAEHQRTYDFELWYWRRLLRVPWTARRSNQSILKEINPEYSLERLMLKLKLQYFAVRGTLRILPQLEMRPSSNAPNPVECREAPPTSSFPDFSEPP